MVVSHKATARASLFRDLGTVVGRQRVVVLDV